MLWIDVSDYSTVVGCDECDFRYASAERLDSLKHLVKHRYDWHKHLPAITCLSGNKYDKYLA